MPAHCAGKAPSKCRGRSQAGRPHFRGKAHGTPPARGSGTPAVRGKMAKNDLSGFSSAFDDLLERSRREWDALSPGGAGMKGSAPPSPQAGPGAPAAAARAPSAAGGSLGAAAHREVLRRSGEYASAARVWDPARSEAAAFLFNRFGTEWQVEVAERRRDGDEFVALVKLTIPAKNLVKSQFGRGRIPGARSERPIQGSAGGIGFSIGEPSGGEQAAPPQPPEDRGYRRAIEDGLAKCVELL